MLEQDRYHAQTCTVHIKQEGRNNKQHMSREGQGDELWGLKGKIKRKGRAQGVWRGTASDSHKKLYINTMLWNKYHDADYINKLADSQMEHASHAAIYGLNVS